LAAAVLDPWENGHNGLGYVLAKESTSKPNGLDKGGVKVISEKTIETVEGGN